VSSQVPFPIENRAGLSAAEFAEIAVVVTRHTSVKHAFDWLLGMTPRVAPVDAIAQDEFSHDILFPYPAGCWLVYECS
jgi:hypothetical protein